MSEILFGALCFGGGLFVGWVFLPAPQWVMNAWARVRGR